MSLAHRLSGFLGRRDILNPDEIEHSAEKLVTVYQDDLKQCFCNELLWFIELNNRVKCSFPNIQSRPATTRPIIRQIGHNAVGRACRFFAARGERVEIMVNNVTVILVDRDTCKINSTCTSTNTIPRTVPGNVRSH